ncbi:hypothetical protein [Pseudooceanicola nanhaiensis]|uniref:hypothetical protein n=1 Tax=Pseudooceanicola nanhaiensis TaxID=375761 RepID=UPI001CD5DD3F|nr:hypothetical protein [Pseudooceanicola nanhaiensis]MCA0922958.1 hypothetical protein [Pseudooceanicola nanhaiensis]
MFGPFRKTWAALTAALIFSATAASAHSFGTGTNAFDAFVEGSNAVLFSPVSLLPCLSLGLLLTLWQVDGMVRAWPVILGAHVVGFLLAPWGQSWVMPALVLVGMGTATLAALLPRHGRVEALVISGTVALFTMLVSLEGHAWLELRAPIYAGIFAAASFAIAAGAGLARFALETVRAHWMRIGLRIAASWLAAVQVLIAAFLLSSTG